jgi:hypothetical protein
MADPITSEEFKAAFIAAFRINRRHIRWKTNQQRTGHMMSHIYRSIAEYLDLLVEYEFNKFDAVFYPRNFEGAAVENILVAIEHENDPRTLYREVQQLCNQNFPLNIFVTYYWSGLSTEQAGQQPQLLESYMLESYLPRLREVLRNKQSQGEFLFVTSVSGQNMEFPIWSFFRFRDGNFEVLKSSEI